MRATLLQQLPWGWAGGPSQGSVSLNKLASKRHPPAAVAGNLLRIFAQKETSMDLFNDHLRLPKPSLALTAAGRREGPASPSLATTASPTIFER